MNSTKETLEYSVLRQTELVLNYHRGFGGCIFSDTVLGSEPDLPHILLWPCEASSSIQT